MDPNNWRSTPPSGEPPLDTPDDWRTHLQPDSRQRIVNKIMDTLKRHLPFSGQEGLNELRKIAVRFEEKIFTAATSQTDYLRRISLKMLSMENKSQNAPPNTGNSSKPSDPGSQGMQSQVHSQGQSVPISLQSNQSHAQLLSQSVPNNMASAGVQSSSGLQSGMPTVSGLTQNPVPNVVGQNSNMQNMSGISQNSLGQGMSSNIFANQQRQMQGRQQVLPQQQQQHLYHQQLQNQLMKQQIQQGNLQPSLMQSHMQQQQNLLPPTQLQSSQHSGMQTSSNIQQSSMQAAPVPGLQHNQQSSLQQSTQSMLQQHQQFRQQQHAQQASNSGIHQQTSISQQSMMPQQQLPPQSQHQQPHTMGQQTNAANTQQNQLIGQQNSIAEMQQQRLLGHANNLSNLQQQQFMSQKNNLSNIHQQQLGPQNSSGLQQQPQLIGAQSGNSSMQTNQQSLHMLSQPRVPLQQTPQSAPNLLPTQGQASQQSQQQQQLMSQMQSQSTLQQQPNQLQPNMQQRLQASGQVSSSLLQSQNLTDQQKQMYQSQRAVPETSSTSLDSTGQTGLANGGDWQEEVYQKIQTLKETYLPELNEMYQKIAIKLQQHDSNPQQPKSEQLDKLKLFKTILERILAFLSVPKANITPPFKEKLNSYEKQIINFVNSNRPRKPAAMLQQGQHPSPHMHSMQQAQPQINQTQSHDNQMNPQLQSINSQGSMPAMQPNMTSMQHNSFSPGVSTPQQTKLNSLQPGSNMDPGQGNALGLMHQVAPGSLQQNSVTTSQQTNFNSLSSQNGVSVLPQNINPLQSNSNMLQHQYMKQQQEQQMLQSQKYKQQFQQRQMQHQYIQQKQQQLQHQQLQQQAKQQLSTQLQTHQTPQLHQMSDANDMRQGMGAKSGAFQHLPAGQRQSYIHQQKPGAQFPTSSPQLLQSASPQMPQHSSPQVDQQNLLTSISKAGTPLQSANSPFVVPSPSTPLAPSPMPGESEKSVQGTSVPNVAAVGNQQGTGVQASSQSPAIGTPGISASPLLAEFTGADGTHTTALTAVSSKSNIREQPLERLMKAVQSISPIALGASVSDIGSVVSMTDRIAGSAPGNGSRAAVGEDLVAMTKCRLQARNFISQDGMRGTKKIRRHTSAIPLNVVSSASCLKNSLKQFGSETSDLESTATSSVKRPRIEANHVLLEEIREINQRLIDTVVDISDEDVDPGAVASTAEGSEGTIVKCSFSAVALSSNLKSQYMSAKMSPIQPLHLLVPSNYPNCSPILLDKFPVESNKDHEDLSVKAKSRFTISLRSLSQPMSLGEIARTWDVCARAVLSDHAKLSGGGNFSSKYGTWENCLSAA